MSTLLGILTALIIASAGFVWYKNDQSYKAKLEERETEIARESKTEMKLKDVTEELEVLPGQVSEAEAANEKLVASEAAAAKMNEELKATAEAVAAKVSEGKAKLDELRKQTEGMGDVKDLAAKMRGMVVQREEVVQMFTAAESELASMTAKDTAAKAAVEEARTNLAKYSKGESLSSLETRIRNIYPNWGFVTLASGDNGGVISNSTLDVVRDGQTIAKLMVTAVESTTASASIIPDSMDSDVTLRVGDRVVPGQKMAPAKSMADKAPAKSN
ncbi:MAG: hypothetical protein HC845_15465 [Akkermansiaceae bacterium]|nr:hypothetical protein [Akkermansiaceae bacterium]